MSKRVSHSLLDPLLMPLTAPLYQSLRIPRRFPPEGIILIGHLLAIAGAIGMSLSGRYWWGGLLAALGVAGNHLADMLDGTHARRSGQCRNGGELLDHFTDPLSFSYWLVGISVCSGHLELGLAAVICLYAIAVLTNIKAKMIGEFTLSRFGPTEFKALLVVFGLILALRTGLLPAGPRAGELSLGFLLILVPVGLTQLALELVRAVREVNARGTSPDTTEWELAGACRNRTARGEDADSPELEDSPQVKAGNAQSHLTTVTSNHDLCCLGSGGVLLVGKHRQ